MHMFYNILKSIASRKKFFFFLVIQLVFVFISINECNAVYSYYNDNMKDIKKIIDVNNTMSFDIKNSAKRKNIQDINVDHITEFYDFISNNSKISEKGGYIYRNNILGLDKNFLSFYSFPISKGRNLTKDDYKDKNNLPVVLGSNFEENYNLGDTISIENKAFTIIGFIKKDTKFLQEGNIFTDSLINLNDYIIMPIYFYDLNDIDKVSFMKSFIFNKPNTLTIDDLEINEKIKELSLDYVVRPFNDIMKLFYNSTKGPAKIKIINSILLLFITMSGLVSSAIVSLLKRKREFGILIALGASKKSILLQVILENTLLVIFSFILSILQFAFYGRYLYNGIVTVNLNITNLFITVCILFIIIISISLILLIQIFKFSSKELIGGI